MVAMLEQFAPEIWIASGPTVTAAGFHYPTRMAVIRLAGGALFVWSPVALSDALGAAVDDLGEVRYLMRPTLCTTPSWRNGEGPIPPPGSMALPACAVSART